MSQRTEKVDSLLIKEVGDIIARDVEPPKGAMITVMRAEVSPDLKRAKIFISILPENMTGSALKVLKKNNHHIQKAINKKLFMKFVPQLSWEVDLTNVKYAAIDNALNQ